jgi:rare lipoprotein A
VRVNDRGPYNPNRVIDVSGRAAHLLGFHDDGVARVRVEYVGRAPLEGSDDRLLIATLREGEPAPSPSLVRVASAKPFLPPISATTALYRTVPIPPDRPFTLGEPRPGEGVVSGRQATDAARVLPPTGAVEAFAATRSDPVLSTGAPPPVIIGRGLY